MLDSCKRETIKDVIRCCLRKKFQDYKPEADYMPFHTTLLGKDRMALYSFIQSLNTTFGTSIYEPVAVELSKERFKIGKSHINMVGQISIEAQRVIQNIMDDLSTACIDVCKPNEIEMIREVAKTENMVYVKPTMVDLWVQNDNELHFFDIKTAKPNKGGFIEFKRTLLEWVAIALAENTEYDINSYIAIPYNPYYPKDYQRWTMKGMLDLENELKVANDFWDFLGGDGTYEALLDCFEQVGVELRPEIDEHFVKFK